MDTQIKGNMGWLLVQFHVLINPQQFMHTVNQLLQLYSQQEVRARLPALVNESFKTPEYITDVPREFNFIFHHQPWIIDPNRNFMDSIIDMFTNLTAYQLYDLAFYKETGNMGINL